MPIEPASYIAAAEDLFGLDIGALKGKTTWQPPHKFMVPIVVVPRHILDQYHEVTLSIDIIFINRIPLFITVLHHLRFRTAELVPNCWPSTFTECLKHVAVVYQQRGFVIQTVLANGKFEAI